jgi:V/A-type H+-transporting ATPase subunit A
MSDGGVVARVNGPLIEVERLPGVAMYEVVDVGRRRLPGEVVAIREGVVTVQAYEYTGGLAPGEPVEARGGPLSVPLGPHLLGGVFDGLLRPLSGAPTWLAPGAARTGTAGARWPFSPAVPVGTSLEEGQRLGTVDDGGPLPQPVLVPAGVRGRVETLVTEGSYPGDTVVATVGGVDVRLTMPWPVRRPRPYRERFGAVEALHTGQRVLDLLYPLARGSTAGVPGGFGTGKTVLLQQLAKWCDADVIVYVGCGERGNEMADVVSELAALDDPRTGGLLARRTVVVANTSNMPMMAREASVYTGVTVAEYFRDMGYHAVVIADSTSRWAEALRELASRTGTLPAEEGYPADLASALAAFYERAGHVRTLGGDRGSVTVVGAVSPPGGDLTEPVTAHTERFVRSLWTLDRDLAYSRHYPAVSWTASFSRDVTDLAAWHEARGDTGWARRRARMTSLLADADRLAELAELVGLGALPRDERITLLAGRLLRDAVLQQSALGTRDAFSGPAKSAALVDAVLAVVDRCQALVAAGVRAADVEDVDFGPLVRARDLAGPDDAAAVVRQRDAMLTRLEGLCP